MKKNIFLTVLFFTSISYQAHLYAQFQVGGIVEVVQAEGDKMPALRHYFGINSNLRGDSPFNPIRVITFLDGEFETWQVHTEILFDDGAVAPRIEGAWIVVPVTASMNVQAGKMPPNFSIYSSRRLSNVNPVVGIPLMFHYKTVLPNGSFSLPGSADALVALRDTRSTPTPLAFGPVFYETCWDRGIEVFGNLGWFEYSIAGTLASLSNPKAESNRGKQVSGRMGAHLSETFELGFSGAYAPYLAGDSLPVPAGKNIEDYKQTAAGYDLVWKGGMFEFVSEGIYSRFEVPYVAEKKLEAYSAYGEVRVRFEPMYVAFRSERMIFSDVKLSSGSKASWDFNLSRWEAALGYEVSKNFRIKLDWQGNFYDQNVLPDIHLYVVQFSANY